jgi:hypothetical protein
MFRKIEFRNLQSFQNLSLNLQGFQNLSLNLQGFQNLEGFLDLKVFKA